MQPVQPAGLDPPRDCGSGQPERDELSALDDAVLVRREPRDRVVHRPRCELCPPLGPKSHRIAHRADADDRLV